MKKIVVVDDDLGISEALSMILIDSGYDVKTAGSEVEAYKVVDEFKPDLILLDLLLSGSDGRDICKKLKQDSRTSRIPIIITSAHPNASKWVNSCLANDFLAKPFGMDKLIEKVSFFINTQSQQTETLA